MPRFSRPHHVERDYDSERESLTASYQEHFEGYREAALLLDADESMSGEEKAARVAVMTTMVTSVSGANA